MVNNNVTVSNVTGIMWYCELFDTETKWHTLIATKYITVVIYFLLFLLGCRNIWQILVQSGYFKFYYLTLQYLLGQIICCLRIISCFAMQQAVKSAK